MIKLEMLMYRDRLSDRQVIERAGTDLAYRLFSGLAMHDELPEPSSLTYFRARLGEEGYRGLFQEIEAVRGLRTAVGVSSSGCTTGDAGG